MRAEAGREAAWRARRRRYMVLALAVGAFLPAAAVTGAGGITTGSVVEWLATGSGLRGTVWAGATGLVAAVLMAWRGLGVMPGLVIFAAAFAAFVALMDQQAGILIATLILVLTAYLVSGALVGYIIAQEEDG